MVPGVTVDLINIILDEFLFTDEEVAGAGDGDVEVVAELLYNVMKNLEQGGRLSEESEGEMGQGIGAIV